MKAIRCLLVAIVLAISGALDPAGATSFSTDQSDLYNNAGESGWGVQLVQRGSVIFATIFVYDQFTIPIWYTATLYNVGGLTWTGDLYLTSGPWFGTVPFNPMLVSYRRVGTMTWTAMTVTTGTLSYSVDGVAVSKYLTRQLLVYDDFAGRYGGGIHWDTSGCFNPAYNGTYEQLGIYNVTQSGQAITLDYFPASGGSCSYPGVLTQAGQMGAVTGSYGCTDGSAGTFQIFEMQVNFSGLTGRFTASSSNPPGCHSSGWFGGFVVTTY
jgi:hypothetical protein